MTRSRRSTHIGAAVIAQLHLEREQLLAGARPRLLRLARLRGVAPDALEDVVQETLLVAWKKFDTLDSPDHAQLWLDEICRNICARHLRASLKAASRHLVFSDVFLASEPEEPEEALEASTPDLHAIDPVEALSREDLYHL